MLGDRWRCEITPGPVIATNAGRSDRLAIESRPDVPYVGAMLGLAQPPARALGLVSLCLAVVTGQGQVACGGSGGGATTTATGSSSTTSGPGPSSSSGATALTSGSSGQATGSQSTSSSTGPSSTDTDTDSTSSTDASDTQTSASDESTTAADDAALSALIDGVAVRSDAPTIHQSEQRLTISAVVGHPNPSSSLVLSFQLATGIVDCSTFPLSSVDDPYVTFMAMPPEILDPTKAHMGACVLDISTATPTTATGTFAVTLGNGVDEDVEISRGRFNVTFQSR